MVHKLHHIKLYYNFVVNLVGGKVVSR